MPKFEILLDGLPVGFTSDVKFPKVWPDIDMNKPGTYNLSADCTLKVKPDNTIKCSYTQKCDPKEQALIDLWLEGAKREPTQSMSFQYEETKDSPVSRFFDLWRDHIGEGAQNETLAPGEIYLTSSPRYSVSAPRTPEPRLEVPFKLKWHSHGVSVVGADGIEFTQCPLDGPFRSGRNARRWAKHKVKVQDTKIVGQLGTLHGMTFHTGPRLDECVIPANTMDNSISVRDMVAQLEEFCKLNPNLEWKWPVVAPYIPYEDPNGQAQTYEIMFATSILKEPARTIVINPGT